jgi:Domain of unknown function (DUF1924)
MRPLPILPGIIALLTAFCVEAGPRNALLNEFTAQAKVEDAGFTGFSASRGRRLFRTEFALGKPETPACTACHTTSPLKRGETRAGKAIEPMAVSMTPDRYTDPKKVAKWFRRNCKSVLGRECTATEKGDFLTYVINQ